MIEPTVIVGEQQAGRSAQVRKALQKLSTGIGGSLLDLAELLHEAQSNNYCLGWGFRNLGDYGEKELGLRVRKSQYLSRIVKVYRAAGLLRSQVEHVQISKLRAITTLDPEGSYFNKETKLNEPLDDHIVRLITEADELTLKQIEAEICRLKGQDGPDKRITRSYNTDESTYLNVIKPAFELMRRKLGSAGRGDDGNAVEYSDGTCIELLCADWLSDPHNTEPLELPEEMLGETATSEIPEDQTSAIQVKLPEEIVI